MQQPRDRMDPPLATGQPVIPEAPADVEGIGGELPLDVEGSDIEDSDGGDLAGSADAAVRGREDVEGIADTTGAGVEQATSSPPDPIDPGGGNRSVI